MSRRAAAGLVAFGVLAYGLALVATVPAARALAWIDPPGITLHGVSGRAWAGAADRLALDAGSGLPPITAVTWDIVAWRLLTGQLHADFEARSAGLEARGRIGVTPARTLIVSGTTLRGPVAGLARQAPFPVAASGQLLARVERARIEAGTPRAVRARAVWSDANLQAPLAVALGDVVVEVEPESDGQRAVIEASGGDLAIDGTASLDADGGYRLEVTLTPGSGASERLREMLLLVAREDGDGNYVIRQSGRLQ